MGFRKNPKEVINDHSNDSADDLDREEPGESEDEEVKRADGHLGRDEQIETRAFPQQYDEVPDESSSVLQLSPREFRKHSTK